jgi:hypothetical protein
MSIFSSDTLYLQNSGANKNLDAKHEISGFRREVHEICALLGHNAVRSGDSFLTFLLGFLDP